MKMRLRSAVFHASFNNVAAGVASFMTWELGESQTAIAICNCHCGQGRPSMWRYGTGTVAPGRRK